MCRAAYVVVWLLAGSCAKHGAATDAAPASDAVGEAAGDGACTTTVPAVRGAVGFLVLLDASITNAGVLAETAQALQAWFAEPQSTFDAGLQFYPLRAAIVPASCTSQAGCPGNSGPCVLKVCAELASIVPCTNNTQCLAAGSHACVQLGTCGSEYCAPPGGTCSANGLACTALVDSVCLHAESCTQADYTSPAVPLAPLPANAAALDAALAARSSLASAALGPALDGALAHAASLAPADPADRTDVVLIAAGGPAACAPDDFPSLAQLAAGGLAGTPSVATHVVAVLSPADAAGAVGAGLTNIAAAGGTNAASVVTGDVTASTLAALDAIRDAASCNLRLPPAPDPALALVADGATVPRVADAAACDPATGGFFFDGGKITLCPASCGAASIAYRLPCADAARPRR